MGGLPGAVIGGLLGLGKAAMDTSLSLEELKEKAEQYDKTTEQMTSAGEQYIQAQQEIMSGASGEQLENAQKKAAESLAILRKSGDGLDETFKSNANDIATLTKNLAEYEKQRIRQSAIEGLRQNEGFFSGGLEQFAEGPNIDRLVRIFVDSKQDRDSFTEALAPATEISARFQRELATTGSVGGAGYEENISTAIRSISQAFRGLGLTDEELKLLEKEIEGINYAQLEKLLKNLSKAASKSVKELTPAEKEALRLGKNFAQFKDRIKGVLASQKTSLENLKLDKRI